MAAIRHIESAANPYIKFVRSLTQKKYRDEHGVFFVEGEKLVSEAINSGFALHSVIIRKGFAPGYDVFTAAQRDGAEVYSAGERIFDAISDTKTPQGILAVLRRKDAAFAAERLGGLAVMLDRVQDPGNVGAILRTCAAAGAEALLSPGCADPFSPKALRAGMGAVFHTDVFCDVGLVPAAEELKRLGYVIIAGDISGEESLPALGSKTAVIIGSEGTGISPELLETAQYRYRLPMRGTESLNAAVAAGIIIYDVFRKGAIPDGK